jgi:hypothetical protein
MYLRIPRPGQTRRRLIVAEARAQALSDAILSLGSLAAASGPSATFTDPAVARIQARRQRIAESGLRVVQGGAA